ncbi:hypothetical protein INR49_008472, partial [Caranx melampygus]
RFKLLHEKFIPGSPGSEGSPKCSHPAEQQQTRGFTRAAPPPRDTDSVPFCTEDSFIPPSFSCHSGRSSAPVTLCILDHHCCLPDK